MGSGEGNGMTSSIPRRLQKLETRAKEIASAQQPHLHTLCFINPDKTVASTLDLATGEWTHFDPPRERDEFGLIA